MVSLTESGHIQSRVGSAVPLLLSTRAITPGTATLLTMTFRSSASVVAVAESARTAATLLQSLQLLVNMGTVAQRWVVSLTEPGYLQPGVGAILYSRLSGGDDWCRFSNMGRRFFAVSFRFVRVFVRSAVAKTEEGSARFGCLGS